LEEGFERHELPALGVVAVLFMIFPLLGAPTGYGASLVVAVLIACRLGPWWRNKPSRPLAALAA
jgi:hypothetical protein